MRASMLAIVFVLAFCRAAHAGSAEDCAQERDPALSIRSCTQIIDGRGKKNNAYAWRGTAFYNKGDYDRAIADYDEALRLAPNDKAVESWRVKAAERKVWLAEGHHTEETDCNWVGGNADAGIAGCTKIIEGQHTKFDVAVAYKSRSLAYMKKGDLDHAIADLNEVIRLAPNDSSGYRSRGQIYDMKGGDDRAIADYDQAIQLNADYDQATQLNKGSAGTYYNRAKLFARKGFYDRAIADLDHAISLDLNYADARSERAEVLLASGNAEAALNDLNEVLRLKPDVITSLWGRGQVYEQLGLRSLAKADYRKAIDLRATATDQTETQNKARARLIVLDAPSPVPSPAVASNQPDKPTLPMGRRVALVIGNSAYKAVGVLPNSKNDAAAVAGELTRLGFEVIERHDLGVERMRRVLGEFEDMSAGAEWAFVYYAGHGMELNGRNWLIPVDAELVRATDTPDEAIPLDRVLDRLGAASKLRIVVLDACRSNPFLSRMVMNRVSTRAVARGLTAIEPSHGEVVFYAARDGNVALDGQGANSPFATALVKHMDEDGIELGRFFRRVTSSVLASTGNQQEPFVYGRIPDEDFYFKPPK